MVCAVRRSRLSSLLAVFGLCAVLAVRVSSALHDPADDPLCNPTLSPGSHEADRLVAVNHAPAHAGHCLVCHAIQSLRAEQESSRFGPPLAVARLVVSGPPPAIRALVDPFAPARAPPVS